MPVDILQKRPDWRGRDVFIVGSGPNGNDGYWRIGEMGEQGANISVLINKAIILEGEIPASYWFCIAPGLPDEGWFNRYVGFHTMPDGPAYFPVPVIASTHLIRKALPDAQFTLVEGQHLSSVDTAIRAGVLRRGAGSVGCVLQLAQQLGAARCVLCGCDMKGRGYFDGTKNEVKRSINTDGTWTQLPMLQRVIETVKKAGVDVVSLTETTLDVEVI